MEEMNETVEEMGASDTHFVTAHGLDMPGHGSSARGGGTASRPPPQVERAMTTLKDYPVVLYDEV